MKFNIFSNQIILPSNKKFGLFFSFIFFVTAVYLNSIGQKNLSYYLYSTSFIFFIIAFFKPAFLLPLNRIWMYVGFFLGTVISPIIMGFIFFIMFTPLAVLMRIFGRDELKLKPESASSYWKSRVPNKITSKSFKNQF